RPRSSRRGSRFADRKIRATWLERAIQESSSAKIPRSKPDLWRTDKSEVVTPSLNTNDVPRRSDGRDERFLCTLRFFARPLSNSPATYLQRPRAGFSPSQGSSPSELDTASRLRS